VSMRLFLSIAAASALLSGHAAAQGFKPTRPVDLIVHTGPGGGSDVFARIVNNIFEQEKLLPVRANVANRSGGGGAAAMAYVAEKKGDPHTIAFYTPVWLTVPLTSKEAHVQFLDLTPIANLIYDPSLIIVRREAPYQSLNDFVEAAKKSPGQLRQAGSSIQAVGNLVRQLLQKQTGASWSYIPMPGGGERIAALLGGHAHIMVAARHLADGGKAAAGVSQRADAAGKLQDSEHPDRAWRRGATCVGERGPRLLGRRVRAPGENGGVAEVSGGEPVRGRLRARTCAHEAARRVARRAARGVQRPRHQDGKIGVPER